MKLALILIHGIGGSSENWAEPVINKLRDKILTELRNILKKDMPTDVSGILAVKGVYWKTALEKPQDALQEILGKYFKWVVGGLSPFASIFKGFFDAYYKFQCKITTQFIGDIIGYMSKGGEMGVEKKIDDALKELADQTGGKNAPLTIISHSLGTVIASNYVFDRMDVHRRQGMDLMDERFTFFNMFTAGSPLALFSMKFNGPESFNRPIHVEDQRGRWINFLDKDDPIAMPLKPLNTAYDKAVLSDYQVDAGWFGAAHIGYFDKGNMLDLIARKLAIDWIALNRLKSEDEIQKLYEQYDKTLGLTK